MTDVEDEVMFSVRVYGEACDARGNASDSARLRLDEVRASIAHLRAEAQREQVRDHVREIESKWGGSAEALHDFFPAAYNMGYRMGRLGMEEAQREQAALVHALETVVVQLDRVPASAGPALGVARRAIAAHRESLGVGVEAAEEATGE